MKTHQLIDCLTNKELKKFSSVMNHSDRVYTKNLFFFLSKHKSPNSYKASPKKEDASLEAVFKAVFKAKYDVSKNYLLRNEYRLLNQALEKFIAQNAISKQDEKFYYLQSILQKGLTQLFNKEAKKEIKKRISEDDFDGLARLHQLMLDQNLVLKTFNKSNLNRDLKLCDDIHFYQNKAYYYRLAELNMTNAYLKKNLEIIGQDVTPSSPLVIPTAYHDDYLSFLHCTTEGYLDKGKKKKENLLKALKLLDSVNYSKLNKEEARIRILNNLALEYLLAFDYPNAVGAFEQLLEAKKLASAIRIFIQFNYLVCLLKNKEYPKAIEVIITEFTAETEIPAPISGKIGSIKAMAWIFAGDLEKAFAELPQSLKEGARKDYFYIRMVYSIIYFLESNLDLAHREIDNVLQIISSNEDLSSTKFCALSLRKYFNFNLQPAKMKSLAVSVKKFIHPEREQSDLLPLLWLDRELMC